MQLTNAPTDEQFPAIQNALQKERLDRYLPAAGQNYEVAFKYYVWNCDLCESFYLSLHFAEVVCRNALHRALLNRCGDNWYSHKLLHTILDDDFAKELTNVCRTEGWQHGANMTSHHVVSSLTFAFWEHLATKRFERFIWAKGLRAVFPCAPKDKTYEDLRLLVESVRRWRNRIAHHRAIFDKGPTKKHQDALDLIKWACEHTGQWVASSSTVPRSLTKRPK
jgi:hypothetical protein